MTPKDLLSGRTTFYLYIQNNKVKILFHQCSISHKVYNIPKTVLLHEHDMEQLANPVNCSGHLLPGNYPHTGPKEKGHASQGALGSTWSRHVFYMRVYRASVYT